MVTAWSSRRRSSIRFQDSEILLADRRDGKPLEGSDGRLRLIIPHEKRYARWVRQIVAVSICPA